MTRVHMRTVEGSRVGGVRVDGQSSQMCKSENVAGFLWFLKKKGTQRSRKSKQLVPYLTLD